MQSKQRGITFIGLLILALVLGSLGFGLLQLAPVYLENMKVVQSVNQVKIELDGARADPDVIRKALTKRLIVEDLRQIDVKKDFIIERGKDGYNLTAAYERRRDYIANVSLLADFEYKVEIRR